jgi:hypothetical protein
MGRRLPIVVDEGNTRPHEPVQAAKFASEAGVIVRESMPVLTHWKEYKKTDKYYNDFVGQLCVSALLYLCLTCILLSLNWLTNNAIVICLGALGHQQRRQANRGSLHRYVALCCKKSALSSQAEILQWYTCK